MQELEHKFDEFGKVKEARVVRNPATGESRGFGFVALDHDDEVDDVRFQTRVLTSFVQGFA